MANINTLTLCCDGERKKFVEANNNRMPREFSIHFLLENLHARTQHVNISLTNELSQHINERMEAIKYLI